MVSVDKLSREIAAVCPEMASSETFMSVARRVFCGVDDGSESRLDSAAEYDAYRRLSDELDSATVGDLIDYLERNFDPGLKLCYMDYVQGFKNDCAYIDEASLGSRFFYKASSLKRNPGEDVSDVYPNVSEDDVIII